MKVRSIHLPVSRLLISSSSHPFSDGIVRAQRWLRGFISIQVHDAGVKIDRNNDKNSDTVKVELMGKETTSSPHQADKTEDIFHEESARRIILPSVEATRTYRFPFSIYTPGRIAPSMEYSDPNVKGSSCRIEYVLVASFQQYTTQRKIHMVGQPLSSKEYPATVVPSVVPVVTKSFSWKNMLETKPRHRKQTACSESNHHHGCLIWAAHVKNTNVGKGEDASFSFSLRNDSAYDVIKLSAKLIEKISWRTQKEARSQATELAYVLMPNLNFMKNQKATLSPHQAQVVPVDHALEDDMHEELSSPDNIISFQVPSKCRDSYKGKLIQVSHHLLIEARTSDTHGKGHTGSTTMEIPLKVFDPPIVEGHHHQHQIPPDVAEKMMTKWPADEEDSHSSFTSIDDNSWDSIIIPQIREEVRAEK